MRRAVRQTQVVGMVQLRPLPGSARYGGEPLHAVVDAAMADAQVLDRAGFSGLQVQNMGDNPSSRRVGPETVAYMTEVCGRLRRAFPHLSLSVLVNWDAVASIAVADAVQADYVRVEHTWVGTSVASWGLSDAQCHEATRFRSQIRSGVPIYADLFEPHAVPLVERPVGWWARAAVTEGGADGLFVTADSFDRSLAAVEEVRQSVPEVPVWLGGGVTAANVERAIGVVDGLTVVSSLKRGVMANAIDPDLASAFGEAVGRAGGTPQRTRS